MGKKLHLSMHFVIITGILLLCVLISMINGSASNITVDDDGNADFVHIQDAVNASQDGDKITVNSGIYLGNIVINKSIELVGNGINNTIIVIPSKSEIGLSIENDSIDIRDFSIKAEENKESITITGIVIDSYNDLIMRNIQLISFSIGVEVKLYCDVDMYECVLTNNTEGIFFNEAGYCNVENCTFNQNEIGLKIIDTSLNVRNSSFISNSKYGLYSDDARPILENNIFSNNGVCGIYSNDDIAIIICEITNNVIGIYITSNATGIVHISGNRIFNNSEFGIFCEERDHNIWADYNWWGHNSGPYHIERNRMGKGNAVSGPIDYYPWMDDEGHYRYDLKPRNDNDEDHVTILFVLLIILSSLFIALIWIVQYSEKWNDQ